MSERDKWIVGKAWREVKDLQGEGEEKIGMREDKGKRFLLSFGQAITPYDICYLLAGR